ncbi:MAG: RluA family pseudouridine synthase [Negativicutes bacterium]|nr:RluA family pseudouridine synthase [Negativicutes bacterium]
MLRFIVTDPGNKPWTLRTFLRSQGISQTLWRKIKKDGAIWINKIPAGPESALQAGDEIVIRHTPVSTITPAALALTIAYEDDYLIIVDKPAGMLVHPASGSAEVSLANAVMHYYQTNNHMQGFHPVLRLDRNTSGLVLIAKQPYIQHLLAPGDKNVIEKRYLAVVTGVLNPREGLIDAPIGRRPGSIIERTVRSDGQPALTRYQTLAIFPQASLLELELLTGRTHQIRVHLSYIGHPLLGDDLYGGSKSLISRQALHAAKLSFSHPVSGEKVCVSSPLPSDLCHLLDKLSAKSYIK